MSDLKVLLFDCYGVLYREDGVDLLLLEMIKSFKSEYQIGLISNMGRSSFNNLLSEDQQQIFDNIFLSGETGLVKPQPEAFDYVCNTMNVAAGQCFFVDDAAMNVEAAATFGMNAYLFIDAQGLIAELQSITGDA